MPVRPRRVRLAYGITRRDVRRWVDTTHVPLVGRRAHEPS
ncbi:hypothetical protein BN2475_40079 [Paraburkholderia ribeironis]|uniref:Uncharacterized protein n=1 Tax=Paraburkholderia ribeironis TaxID=1247936 RepID=A0A1N7RJG9_9BURK|nr:hypothetical protein BN2475_40079 [Paraburkholderia ribeironis]